MVDVTELLFKVTTSNDGGLDKVDQAVKKIASDSGLSGQALTNLEKGVRTSFDNMSAAGLNFDQIIKRLAASGDTVGRGVAGAAKEIQQSLKDAADATSTLVSRQKQLQQASSGLQSAIANPLQALSGAASSAATALGPVGLVLAGLATAATLGGKAMFDLVDRTSEAALATQNMALKLGITSGAMYALQAEAKITGVNITGLTMAGRQLSIALEDSSGAGHKTAAALRQLGISLQDASGHARQEGEVLQDAIDKLGAIPDATQRAAMGFEAFGGRSYKEIQILIDKSSSLKQSLAELGVSDQSELIDNLAQGAQKINEMSTAWDLLKAKLAEKISPIIIPITRLITDVLSGRGRVDGAEVRALLPGANSALDATIDVAGAASLKGSQAAASLGQSEINRTNPLGAASMARGAQISSSFQASQANTEAGRKAAVEANTLEIKKLTDMLAKGGLSGETATATASQISSLQAKNAAIEAAEKRAREAEAEMARLRNIEQYPGLSSTSELQRLLAEKRQSSDLVGPANADLVDKQYDPKISAAVNALLRPFQEMVKHIAESIKKTDDEIQRGAQKLNEELAAMDVKRAARLHEIEDNFQIKSGELDLGEQKGYAGRREQQAQQLAQLQVGENSPAAINLAQSSRVQTALTATTQSVAEIDAMIARVKASGDDEVKVAEEVADLTLKRMQTESAYREEIDKAQLDAQLKLAELQKQQLDSYKSEAKSIFDALREPRGIQQWLKGQANDLLGTLFSNAAAPILQKAGQAVGGLIPGQADASGKPTGLGGLLSGTILDSNRAAPQAKALDTNTAAINKLTSVISGTTVGGQSASAAPGSPADALAQIVSSTPSSGSPAQAMQTIAGVGGPGTASTGEGGYSAGQAVLAQIAGAVPHLASPSGSSAGSIAGLKGILGGATSGIGNWGEIFSGSSTNSAGVTTTYTPAQQIGAGIGTAAAAGAGIYESVNQFSKGGASGISGGIGAATGTAAMLDPDPFSKSILGAISLASELVKALVPTGPQIRAAQIQNQTQYDAYVAPPVLNRQLNTSGDETFTNKYGQVQGSEFSSIQEIQPYKYESPANSLNKGLFGNLFGSGSLDQNWETQAGQVIEPYQAPGSQPGFQTQYAPAGTAALLAGSGYGSPPATAIGGTAIAGTTNVTHVTIHALDAQSIMDRGPEIATAVQQQVRNGHPVGLSLQQALVGT